MKLPKILLSGLIVLFINFNLSAQDMQAKKLENPNWNIITFVKFKPGHKDAAVKIIHDYFVKADQNAGIDPPVIALDMATGEYDYVISWKLKEGTDALNWEMSPEDVKWFGELGKMLGGADKAQAKVQEFFDHVDIWKTELGRNEIK